MITIIIGGSGSGKSEYAEDFAVKQEQENLLYIATMKPFDDESKLRIKKHRSMRNGKNFKTVECYTGIDKLVIADGSTVLLECLSNLVANEMFMSSGAKENTYCVIQKGIEYLTKQANNLIIVTNNVFDDGCQYENETIKYLELLGHINQWISSIADRVIEVIHGIPVIMKQ